MRPPAVDHEMMSSMRTNLSGVVALMAALQSLGIFTSIGFNDLRWGSGAAAIGAPAAWLLYAIFPLHWLKMFRHDDQAGRRTVSYAPSQALVHRVTLT